jgi:cytochrome aa3-600 menaquinol oxidase subunit 3
MTTLVHETAHGATHAPSTQHLNVPLEYSTEEESLRVAGFWLFLVQDMIMFACLFATYLVMQHATAGGPTAKDLYDVKGFMIETFLLLVSSFTCGLGTLEMRKGNRGRLIGWLIVTILLGAGFIGMEVSEFYDYALRGATPQVSGFLSSFFILVGTHGLHVSIGILWIIAVMIQLGKKGITPALARKVFNTGLYWHFLDVVWIFIFTAVYLTGVMS